MAKNSIILSLSKVEQEALALCGITQDEQLARLGPNGLLRDIETAAAVFPELLEFRPEYQRLEYICQQAAATVKLPQNEADDLWLEKMNAPVPRSIGVSRPGEGEVRRFSAATGRMLVKHEARKAIAMNESHKKDDPRGFSHAIRCAHPFATYLAAWATLLIAIAVMILLLSVAGLLIGIEVEKTLGLALAVGLVVAVVSYAIMLPLAPCSTCRIGVFSFRRYARHRKAHYIPLLGYTLATALSVIFRLRYRCPSCGTPQKLFVRRHSRRCSSHR